MQTLQAVIVGLTQGLSEFLPISSSAHITFANEIFNMISGTCANSEMQDLSQLALVKHEEIFLDIIVHLATLIAVVIYFFDDLKKMCRGYFFAIKNKDYKNPDFKCVNYIFLGTILTGIVGLLIKTPVEKIISTPSVICCFLFVTGIILLLSEKMYKGDKEISLKTALIMGIAQGLAVFPGFSRSGLTMASALFLGANRTSAARFSFLMSIPVIFLASMVYPFLELDLTTVSQFNLKAIALGFLVSFASGYLCIKYFMKLLKKATFRFFAYYCFAVSVLMFVLFQVCHRI